MELPKQYTLPYLDFVAGSTQELHFKCYFYANHAPVDLTGGTAIFSVTHYVNKYSGPIFTKQMDFRMNEYNGVQCPNILHVKLEPEDTASLSAGKYIYQITVTDAYGNVDIPYHGIIHLFGNIDRNSLN